MNSYIGSPKEQSTGEARVAITPDSAIQIQKLGFNCAIESGAGLRAGFPDEAYRAAGVTVVGTATELYAISDVIVKVRAAELAEMEQIGPRHTVISFVNPAGAGTLLSKAVERGASLIAMDMVPRISRAQKMDALSSMANIAGYRAVIEASSNFGRFFTGQVTAAGKVPPAKILVIGAGVAGLAAIGTATSLGAVTYAFDVRPEVAEQIESMGAKFVYLDFDDDAQDGAKTGGYASPSSPEFREKQLAKFREMAPDIDIVITTALIPGRDAPKLWLSDMVSMMKPGSVVVDLAAERGGNCELTVVDQRVVTDNGVIIIGYTDYPSRMAAQASTLYATNIRHMITDLCPTKDGRILHNMDDDVIRGATVVHQGKITYPPPPPRIQAIAGHKIQEKTRQRSPAEQKAEEAALFAAKTKQQMALLIGTAVLLLILGAFAPSSLMSHLVVFALACFIGFQVIWNVSHSLHTPLMAVTNAVSGIVLLGSLLQIGSQNSLVVVLAAISVLIATVNIVGGFLVTRRMLAMFQRS